MRNRGVRGIRPRFRGLSPCGGQVAYVLLTSAPVAARRVATPAMPLDLHVLSLSLAFILSQDQTLRCCILVFFFSLDKKPRAVAGMRDFCLGYRPTTSRPLSGPRPIYCCLFLTCRELDMELGFPFLVSCTVNSSSDCKHFKDRATLPFWRQKNRSLNSSSREAKSLQNYCNFSKHASVSRFFFADHPIFFAGMGALAFADAKVQPFSEPPNFFGTFFQKNRKKSRRCRKKPPHT